VHRRTVQEIVVGIDLDRAPQVRAHKINAVMRLDPKENPRIARIGPSVCLRGRVGEGVSDLPGDRAVERDGEISDRGT